MKKQTPHYMEKPVAGKNKELTKNKDIIPKFLPSWFYAKLFETSNTFFRHNIESFYIFLHYMTICIMAQ